ncbi:MAG TPA: MarR family transcriptional regulator [Steroidobacteraceae bacterium]|nr:MarR family transcriptional regulator [Steroidobacteraceae bacterium]
MPSNTVRPRRRASRAAAAARPTARRSSGGVPDASRRRGATAAFDPYSESLIDSVVAEWGSVVPRQDADAREIAAIVMRIAMLLGRDTERVLARYGLLDTEFRLLGGLRRAGPPFCLSPSELSPRYVPVTSGGMTGLITRLARRGLVRRKGHPVDGRGVLVELTEAGRRLIEEVMAAVARREALMVLELRGAERRVAARLLRRLLRAANAGLGMAPLG